MDKLASVLRNIVAGPRNPHPEANLDLCYVTSQIIATSGPSGTYPQRAYRNPLDQLVKFLDERHGNEWAIWEFRAEGTGYPDEEVYGRVFHYPWPDHHPPPFRVVGMAMAGMKRWLSGLDGDSTEEEKKKRVVVVHCKAGKGRSGTMACSYLISECGWKAQDALDRFTERRMRPGFGQGVSIPSQLRYVGYVDRWTNGGKIYVERQIEIVEVHVWGLRDGVKVVVEGYVDDGKVIKQFHVFTKKERIIIDSKAPSEMGCRVALKNSNKVPELMSPGQSKKIPTKSKSVRSKILRNGDAMPSSGVSQTSLASISTETLRDEEGGQALIFKPSTRVILPSSDINMDFERRNKATMGYTMVTSVAHVWFNTYFEGNGPEQGGKADMNGVFNIEWDKMDGLKGSSRKGTRAFDKLAVVWKVFEPEPGLKAKEDVIREPSIDSPIQQMTAADWKGGHSENPEKGKNLGLRTESPASANISKANSVISSKDNDEDDDDLAGVKSSDPTGDEYSGNNELEARKGRKLKEIVNARVKAEQAVARSKSPEETSAALDTASLTTPHISTPTSFGGPSRTVMLPGGVPEEDMKNAHEHKLGHLASPKNNIYSS
ncbi:hypothetical protein BJ878DRAFT_536394 [Calycina marina]|uniref:phosphatidylinositol-3,4,5-trisphosphate 3-phosphatase n=1 Tax=Calycina marina TaxID=1763456 RepID=A0A9P8CC61_9HELO|nr:hypothetical protein BJ878DRAFT_536394 [Calycina marina]